MDVSVRRIWNIEIDYVRDFRNIYSPGSYIGRDEYIEFTVTKPAYRSLPGVLGHVPL